MFHGMFHAYPLDASSLASLAFPAAEREGREERAAVFRPLWSGLSSLARTGPQAVFFSCFTDFRKNPYLLCAGA